LASSIRVLPLSVLSSRLIDWQVLIALQSLRGSLLKNLCLKWILSPPCCLSCFLVPWFCWRHVYNSRADVPATDPTLLAHGLLLTLLGSIHIHDWFGSSFACPSELYPSITYTSWWIWKGHALNRLVNSLNLGFLLCHLCASFALHLALCFHSWQFGIVLEYDVIILELHKLIMLAKSISTQR
jgi:hypothetical protein